MIDELTLTNFKAFQRARIPLGRLTLLSGLNSSGKSTVLQALAMLRQSLVPDLGVGEDGLPVRLLLNGDLVELGTVADVLHEDWVPSVPNGLASIGVDVLERGRLYSWLGNADTSVSEQNLLELVHASGESGGPTLIGCPFQYLTADRITPATSYPRSYQVAIGRGFLGARGEHTVNFLRHHAEDEVLPPLRHPGGRTPQLVDQVEAWMGELCPGVNLTAEGIDGTDTVRLTYGFGATAGLSSTRRRRPTNVGFGLTYVLPVVVACLSAAPTALLLLENPEAHLHPRGQTRMAELLSAAVQAGAQVIVESHSDHVLNGVRLAVKSGVLGPEDVRLHYFRSSEGKAVFETPVLDADGMLSAWPDGFFDEWEATLDRLLS